MCEYSAYPPKEIWDEFTVLTTFFVNSVCERITQILERVLCFLMANGSGIEIILINVFIISIALFYSVFL